MQQIPTSADPAVLMIDVDWRHDDGTVSIGRCGRLTCGHFTSPVHPASSQWDFPSDAHRCSTCGAEVQLDLRLQAALYAEADEIVGEDQTVEATRS